LVDLVGLDYAIGGGYSHMVGVGAVDADPLLPPEFGVIVLGDAAFALDMEHAECVGFVDVDYSESSESYMPGTFLGVDSSLEEDP